MSRRKRSKSVLCLPIVKQKKLVGALYLENNLAPFVFTPDRVTVLQLLASQAAISLENAALYTDLQLQVGLLQHLPVSAWTLKPDGTPDFVNQVWLEFAGQTLDFVRSHPEAWMTAVHPEDRETAAKSLLGGSAFGTGFCVRNPVSPRSGRDLSLAPPASRGLARCRRKSPQIRRYDDRHRRPEAYRRGFAPSAGRSRTHQSGDNHGRINGIPGS